MEKTLDAVAERLDEWGFGPDLVADLRVGAVDGPAVDGRVEVTGARGAVTVDGIRFSFTAKVKEIADAGEVLARAVELTLHRPVVGPVRSAAAARRAIQLCKRVPAAAAGSP